MLDCMTIVARLSAPRSTDQGRQVKAEADGPFLIVIFFQCAGVTQLQSQDARVVLQFAGHDSAAVAVGNVPDQYIACHFDFSSGR